MSSGIDNPSGKRFYACNTVTYTLNGHSGNYIQTDVSANFNPDDVLSIICYGTKPAGDNHGVRESGSAAANGVSFAAGVFSYHQVLVRTYYVELLEDTGAGGENNSYLVVGFWR